MKYSVASIAYLISISNALSLPPLIPSIPGVTEPLTTNAPPLPILQVPTPPLESPPFTPSDIKPKKIGYFWTGAGDKFHKGTNRPMEYTIDFSLLLTLDSQIFWLPTVLTMYEKLVLPLDCHEKTY